MSNASLAGCGLLVAVVGWLHSFKGLTLLQQSNFSGFALVYFTGLVCLLFIMSISGTVTFFVAGAKALRS